MDMRTVATVLGVLGCDGGAVARRADSSTEVPAMFAELRTREEQHLMEHGRYLATGATDRELYPTAAGSNVMEAAPATWKSLRVRPPLESLQCGYVVLAGAAGEQPPMLGFPADLTTRNWYVLVARCGESVVVSSSVDPAIQPR